MEICPNEMNTIHLELCADRMPNPFYKHFPWIYRLFFSTFISRHIYKTVSDTVSELQDAYKLDMH